jgi:hypothetical protein
MVQIQMRSLAGHCCDGFFFVWARETRDSESGGFDALYGVHSTYPQYFLV